MEQKRCISSLTLAELSAELKALGQPGFRAKQIFHWVHQKLVTEFSAMTDQPKTLLAKLEEHFYIAAPQIERRQEAKDGTVKYLLRMADGNCIETVVMRYHAGGLPDGLPVLRLYAGGPRPQLGGGRDLFGNLYRPEGYRRAHLAYRSDGHRRAAG